MNKPTLWIGSVLLFATVGAPVDGRATMDPACPSPSRAHPADTGKKVTFLTRNLYLGGDLHGAIGAVVSGNGLAILTQVGELWATVQATNLPTRAIALANEIKETKPDLVGLQECEVWSTGPAFDPAPADTVVYDYLATLLAELAARDVYYDVAAIAEDYTAEFPGFVPGGVRDIRIHDREVLLVRRDVGLTVSNAAGVHFATNLILPIGGGSFSVTRGWVQADITVANRTFRVLSTHLDADHPGVRAAQGLELLNGPCATAMPTVLLGDLNSDANGGPTSGPYLAFRGAGFGDAWEADHPGDPGITCCHDELVSNPVPFSSGESKRIDFVLYRGGISPFGSDRIGDVTADMFQGLWPSDHAGVVATLRIL